jgi:hypothetical protein
MNDDRGDTTDYTGKIIASIGIAKSGLDLTLLVA